MVFFCVYILTIMVFGKIFNIAVLMVQTVDSLGL